MSELEHSVAATDAERIDDYDDYDDYDDSPEKPNYRLHLGLFFLTCATTYLAGGPAFAATLIAILFCHEMGHYIAARVHGIDASLPFFIPLPPQISALGTLGAVIRMRNPIADRNKLIDVGAAGPIAGLVVAIPMLIIGLSLSEVGYEHKPVMVEGNSIAYIALKYLVKGMYLPAADGWDVHLHPIAWAAWVGLLVTMINLIPIGQLDGGHVARAYLGNKHEKLSGWFHWVLLLIGAVAAGWLVFAARKFDYSWGRSIFYGFVGAMPWLVWSLLLLGMRKMAGGQYHPPVNDVPLTRGRRWLVYVVALIFILIFMPIPFREKLLP